MTASRFLTGNCRFLFPAEHASDARGHGEHDHRDLDEFGRDKREHTALGVQFPGSDHQENEVHDDLRQYAESAPLPGAIQEKCAPRADEHPDVVRVDEREQQDIRLALVVCAVAAPAGALVE